MPAITYADFSGGLDRRLPVNVQDSSRLWVLRNAYITLGKRIRKRPGLRRVVSGLAGSYGLESINGSLCVFVDKGSSFVTPTGLTTYALDSAMSATIPFAPGNLMNVVQAVLFQGYVYVVALHASSFLTSSGTRVTLPVPRHHYLDSGVNTNIVDANCPQRESVTVAASRIFGIGGNVVRYCAAGNARDWTTASDAGFLGVSLQQDTRAECTAVGTFQDSLAVFFSEGIQVWDVAVSPSANQIRKRIFGVGCDKPYTLASWANDLAFLSPFGFRSVTVVEQTDRIDDTDVGVQIDPLVAADLATYAALPAGSVQPLFGIWIPQLGQYWTVIDQGSTSKAWVFTYSKSSKIACWSEFTFPVRISGITTKAGKVYARTADVLYEIDATQYTDDGTTFEVEVQMAFQDAKSPGVLKQVYGSDYVFEGSPTVSFKYDPTDLTKETIAQTLTGDTRPGDTVPVEVCAAALAPVFRHQADEAFEVSAVTLYYNLLGIQG